MRFPWRGPAAPDDLIFIAEMDLAESKYPASKEQRHDTSQGSPAVLTAPAKPGSYEIRYYSFANGGLLARASLDVTPAQVTFEVQETIRAGHAFQVDWSGPSAPGDLLFIAEKDMAENRYYLSNRKRHEASSGTPAMFVAPAQEGEYELRYFSYHNGAPLARRSLKVSAADVRFSVPESVNPGALMKIPWQGPDAQGDLIFIAKPDMAKNRYRSSERHSHKTSKGPLAELVAPAEPGLYEIRYFSYANGSVLGAQKLEVR
jgi:Ca-activated chloride channel family protein